MSFSVTVRDHMMVAHSLDGALFGPAQRLHGATFVVDATFRADDLTAEGVVIDMGRAAAALNEIVGSLTYRNLDDSPEFAGRNTTTEALCRHITDALADRATRGALGTGGDALTAIAVTLYESHIAWATYERKLP